MPLPQVFAGDADDLSVLNEVAELIMDAARCCAEFPGQLPYLDEPGVVTDCVDHTVPQARLITRNTVSPPPRCGGRDRRE